MPVLVLLALLTGDAASQDSPSQPEERHIEVIAQGRLSMTPDGAAVVFRIEDSSTSASDSYKVCAERVRKISKDIEELKIPGLTLAEGPVCYFAGSLADPETDSHRRVTCRIDLAAALALKGEDRELASKSAMLIDAAGRSGGYPISNPAGHGHLFFRVDRIDDFTREICCSGLDQAKLLAAAIASRMGVKAGRVISVADLRGSQESPDSDVAFAMLFSSCPAGERWVYDGRKIEWRKNMKVRFSISE